jgi:hypothetical protein
MYSLKIYLEVIIFEVDFLHRFLNAKSLIWEKSRREYEKVE